MTAVDGLRTAAKNILCEAVTKDNDGRFVEALTCYTQGIDLLLRVRKAVKSSSSSTEFHQVEKNIDAFMNRAEKIKLYIERENTGFKNRRTLSVKDDSIGHSYKTVFSDYVDNKITSVEIFDPYVRLHHQLLNFLRFCEMLVSLASNLREIKLTTGHDESAESKDNQRKAFHELKSSLACHKINFTVEYSSTLHDREIKFDNGWIIKIGRGLDYFKNCSKFSIGFWDFDQRKCHETTIDIFYTIAPCGFRI